MNDISTAVLAILTKELGGYPDELTVDSVIADHGADSLDVIEIVMELEKAFVIAIPDEEIELLKTVGDFVACVDRARSSTVQGN